MKKLVILSAIAAGSLFISKANAQVSIQFGINVPAHRVYVPTPPPPPPPVIEDEPVYDDNVNVSDDDDYYYLPEVEAYYNVGAGCYYYNDGSRWVSCAYLPGAYRDYNWRTAVRYEVRAPRPFMHHDYYRQRWGGYMGDRGNWGHRFDRRPANGYAYRPGWGGDRGGWGRRPNPYDSRGNWDNNGRDNRGWGNRDNRGNWGNGNNNHDNRGNWGNGQQPNNGNHDNHGGWGNGQQQQQQNNGDHGNHGNWGGRQSNGGGGFDRGNGGERFTQNGNSGRGMRRF
ncbi:hypothetical protein [Mucilaginibacter kameinonensis]|uniref:hypothetical protein n=1 Tax=Mucilaginibacter kameinonensis TaxID=452286 RepID=UPI000EF7EB91|nr:hypothetical protein [Mucilaginibacter kameinonensis]